jgi:hypothetical protein
MTSRAAASVRNGKGMQECIHISRINPKKSDLLAGELFIPDSRHMI